jgi:hypothetical protein
MEERQIGCAAIGQGPRERRSSAPGGQLARLIDKTMDLQTTAVMAPRRFVGFSLLPLYCGWRWPANGRKSSVSISRIR